MKRILLSLGRLLVYSSFIFATIDANVACRFIYHQPEAPERVKQLRRF